MIKRAGNNNLKFYSFLLIAILIGIVVSACEVQTSSNQNKDSGDSFDVKVPKLPDSNQNCPKVKAPECPKCPEPEPCSDNSDQTPVETPEENPEPVQVPVETPEPVQVPVGNPEPVQTPVQIPVTSQFTVPPLGGNIYYVSTSGNNANPGTKSQPWATPGYGSRQLHPGDTLIILGGRYSLSRFDDDILSPPSGTANAWVAIRGENGHRPVLAGSNNLFSGVNLNDAHYVWLDNFELTSDNGANFRDGINAGGGVVNHVILSNLYIHHLDEFGIDIADTDDLQILNSQITYTGYGSVGGPEGQQGGWRNVLIKGSSLSYSGHYYHGGPGPSPYDRPDGFGIEPSNGPIEIVDTIAEHNRGDGLDSKARNTYIHNCIVSNNFADGVKLWGTGSKLENCLIYGRGDGNAMSTPWASIVIDTTDNNGQFELKDNTIDSQADQSYLMYAQYDHNVKINLIMSNNIFSSRGNNAGIYLNSNVGYTAKNNVFWFPNTDHVLEHSGVTQFTSANIAQLGSGNTYANPLFTQTGFGTNGNYKLQASSPAKNAGKIGLR